MDNRQMNKFKEDLESILDNNTELIDQIIESLNSNRIFQYSEPGEINLLSTPGRVLAVILLDPEITQRAMSVYLGISETMVEKTIKMLSEKGLITKTKVNRKNVYRFNKKFLLENADIQRLPGILNKIITLD